MFTLQQIRDAHAKVKSGADFPRYIQDIKALGLTAYETFVSDGHVQYYGTGEYTLITDPKYPAMIIASEGAEQELAAILLIHQQGKTDYATFCRQAAEAGVEKWTVSIDAMTCTYYSKQGHEMLKETIPNS